MNTEDIIAKLVPGTILEGPYFAEPVKIVTAKNQGNRVSLIAEGLNTAKTWKKLIKLEDFLANVKLTTSADRAMLSGDPKKFRLAAEAHRIRMAYQYDPHFAVSVSQIDPLPHQLDGVYTHLLTQPRIRFLIADDPGAGKTIMAGLLLKEMKFRGLIERVLIVTPANLMDQWRRELYDKFQEAFDIINRNRFNSTYPENVWEKVNQCITSVDFVARSDDVREKMRDVHWDLVIVDEAHKMAAYRYGQKINTTARYEFGKFISERTDHMLFLTATPHKGDPENFALLLQLLDSDLYVSGKILTEASEQDENRIMLRRLKEDMKKFNGEPCFPPRHVKTTPYKLKGNSNGPPYEASELGLYTAVTDYVTKNFRRAEEAGNQQVGLALTVLQRRLASSLTAIRHSLERREKRLKELRKLGRILQEYKGSPEDPEVIEDLTESERWKLEDDAVERLTMAENMAELEEEIRLLGDLVKLARRTEKECKETKFEELRSLIQQHIAGTSEKLLIFTEHRDTLESLLKKLGDLGFRVTKIHGGMPLHKRVDAEREFFESAQIMVATEAAGEGINLQFCSLMINYDIPWNPNRLEQRMGRIHRYKQQKEVMIFNLVASNTREGQVLARILHKLEIMRKQLGSDRVYDVIGEIIPAPRLDQLMKDWLSQRRTMAEILEDIELETDEKKVQSIREHMEDKALGSRFIDMTALNADRQKSRENRLMPEYIERFFIEAYKSFGGTVSAVRNTNKGIWSIPRVTADLRKIPEVLERKFGKVANSYPKLTFDKERIVGYSDIEFVGPGHPLFEAVLDKVLKEYGMNLQKGAVFQDADCKTPMLVWFVSGGVEDGRGRTIGRRMFAVRVWDEKITLSQPYALLDLKIPDCETSLPESMFSAAADEDNVINWYLDNGMAPYFTEIKERRNRELAIMSKYVQKSLNHLITESNRKIAKYDLKLRNFSNPNDPKSLSIRGNRAQEATRRDDYMHRRDKRIAEIEQERHLTEMPPEVIGVAAILPMEIEDPAVRRMTSDPEVESIAISVAMKYERGNGRKPISVEEENCGWDITSLKDGQVARYVEVKGRADQGGVCMTENEWIKAQRFGDDYWLYIVTDCRSNPKLNIIQNPAAKLSPSEEVKIVRYIVKQEDWKKVSEDRK